MLLETSRSTHKHLWATASGRSPPKAAPSARVAGKIVWLHQADPGNAWLSTASMEDVEDDAYDNRYRAFLQAFIARSILTFEEAKPILASIFGARGMFIAICRVMVL